MSQNPDRDPVSQAPLSRFDDGKAADALRTIGEVTKALGVRQHVLRYWDCLLYTSPSPRDRG